MIEQRHSVVRLQKGRGWRRGAVWLIILMLLLHWMTGSDLPQAQAQLPSKVGQEVIDTLRTRGNAHVVIALREPPAMNRSRPNLVNLKREVAGLQARVLASVSASDYRPGRRYGAVPALAGTILTQAGLAALAAHPDVVRIDLDVGGTGDAASSVSLIGANRWQAKGITGANVVVAILDTGIDTDNVDLADDLIDQECFLDEDGSINGIGACPNGSDRQSGPGAAEDDAGHGTHVAGIVTSKGTHSPVGVAPDAKIVAIKVLDNSSFSGSFMYVSEIVAALDFVLTDRPDVRVITMSLGTFTLYAGDCDTSTAFNMASATAINLLRARGVIAFASSGNNGSGSGMTSPACLKNVVSVGATDSTDTVASFTNSDASTDIMAPGVDIESTAVGNGEITESGTSMASPHAAGCAALFLQAGEAVTPDAIEARLKSSPFMVTASTNGRTFPRIDCSPRPPIDMAVSGPLAGLASLPYSFTAATSTLTATQPLSYTWETGEQPSVTHSMYMSDTVSFTWTTPGPKTITVSARNAGGVITSTHVITISAVPPGAVTISGPSTGTTGNTYQFTATTSPITVTGPLTYTWEATDHVPVTQSAGVSDTISLSWNTPGIKVITVKAVNSGGTVMDEHTIILDQRLYLPMVRK